MDFTPYALDALYAMSASAVGQRNLGDGKTFLALAMDLEQSFKFIVPSPSELNAKVTDAALPFMRLPYPVCAFEYSIANPVHSGICGLDTTASSKRIALAYDLQSSSPFVDSAKRVGYIAKDARGIAVISIYYVDDMKQWMPSAGFGVYDVENIPKRDVIEDFYVQNTHYSERPPELEGQLLLENNVTNFAFASYPLITHAKAALMKGGEEARIMRMNIANDVTEELAMAMRVSLMLNAKNLKVVKAVEAPAALNKKRKAKHRSLFYDYHTIDIFLTPDGTRVQRKKINAANIKTTLFRSKSGLHAVTGHFKTRKTGIYWWNSFTRGSKQHGVINKEYNVTKEKAK